MLSLRFFAYWLAASLVFLPLARGELLSGKVISISDGDTLTILAAEKLQIKIRLAGIDAPESRQAYGRKSKAALAAMVFGKNVAVSSSGHDAYHRVIGWIECGHQNVNREMIRRGWAWHYVQYNRDPSLALLQKQARAGKRGLWNTPHRPMGPWQYRAMIRRKAERASAR